MTMLLPFAIAAVCKRSCALDVLSLSILLTLGNKRGAQQQVQLIAHLERRQRNSSGYRA